MSTLLQGHPEVQQAYGKYQQFNHDEELRALDEAHQRYLHDYATDMEAAHGKGKDEGIEIGVEKGIGIGEIKSKVDDIMMFLEDRFGQVPESIIASLNQQNDLGVLRSLLFRASQCSSLDEFAKAMK